MKSKISAMMDGELDTREVAEPLAALRGDENAAEAWRTYHLISDALRDTSPLSRDFTERVAARLAEEPTVLAPGAGPAPARSRWFELSAAAASVAAVALVAWLGIGPPSVQNQAPAPLAKAPAAPQAAAVVRPVAQAQTAAKAKQEPARIPLPVAADDYLLAHQGFSPRNSLQGMAPYVRTVSGDAAARKP